MRTLGDDAQRQTSGFDYLRLLFASMVIVWHCVAVTSVPPIGQSNNELVNALFWDKHRAAMDVMVPGFFIISGFLVAGSLARNRISAFLALRLVRVWPGLILSVFFCALVLGPLVTGMSRSRYFTDPLFARYFLNAVALLQPKLPGVFEHNPLPGNVNGSLWTIYYELMSYFALAWLAVVGAYRRPRFFLAIAVGAYLCVLLLDRQFVMSPRNGFDGYMLMACFLAGSALFLNGNSIPSNPIMAAIAGAVAVVLMSSSRTDFLAAWPLAYCVIWLGLRDPPRTLIVTSGDYSYGLYLLSHPISQALWWAGAARTLPLNLAMTFAISFGAAWLSWRFVERPALRRKASVALWATQCADVLKRRWLARSEADRAPAPAVE
jgi:peptidoglycan/LPS O-acetylase OafA/YrhL